MTWRARRRRCRPISHLDLEPLEDRVALSGSSAWTATPIAAPAPVAPLTSSLPTGGTGATQSTGPTYATSTTATSSTDTTPDDDSQYATSSTTPASTANSASTTSSYNSPTSSQPVVSQGQAGGPTTQTATMAGSTGSATGTVDSATQQANAAQQSSGQTSSSSNSTYYPADQSSNTTNSQGEYYPASYYASAQHSASEADSAENAARTEQAKEVAASLVLQSSRAVSPAASPEPASPPQSPSAETSSAVAVPQASGQYTAGAVSRITDVPLRPSSHAPAADDSWLEFSDPLAAGTNGASGADEDARGISFAYNDGAGAAVPEPGILSAGVTPLDLAALERGVSRFFAHLEEQGTSLMNLPSMASLGSWLVAGAAATAAFELARRLNRMRLSGAAETAAWRAADWLNDSDLALLPPRDEP